ncbi:dienelactone hydrolase family protein [Caldimonas thermodepolymerans]|uniref:dienelactone hydrolase family protein n=1 Tax=Caldimonas thermodepolymerans TaxID=215580 RepID=UPI002236301D|nr:dienelactone hydrolase family protein [Caldimonas thermodepolymerans]UZG42678.1 dienelactone hydrolase family protein [Caldimonas thermodepolymerans]
MSGWLELGHADGRRVPAWHAPARQTGGRATRGVVMLPEVYNVNPWVRSAAQRFAEAGAEVLVLDLYWRQGRDLHFSYDQPEAARGRGEVVQAREVAADVQVAAAWLRETLGPQARIVTLGYCLGGQLAVLARTAPGVDGAIGYYGVRLDEHLDTLAAGGPPALLHFGDDDPWVPADTVGRLQALAESPQAALQVQVHPGAGHGFARQGHPPWHPEADARAHAATLAFLERLRCRPCAPD